jgi:hypothetical protein
MKTFYLKEAPGIRRQVSAKDRPETMKREQISAASRKTA